MGSAAPLLIRADASSRTGTGHVMRCIALAQAWRATGGTVTLAMALDASALYPRLAAENINIHLLHSEPGSTADAAQTAKLARTLGARWVVTDGYHFGSAFQHAIVEAGLRLLLIDDYGHAAEYTADLVLNQNSYAAAFSYPQRSASTRLLLGTRYALLRNEFAVWRGWQRGTPDVARRILVTFGGSDPDNMTLRAIQALQQVHGTSFDVRVVVGAANQYRTILEEAINCSPLMIQVLTTVTDMPGLMAWADLAVSAMGSTSWELAFMGLPIVGTILAKNQQYIAESLAAAGIAINAGWHTDLAAEHLAHIIASLSVDSPARHQMSERGRALVDGRGAWRVVEAMHMIDQ
jgi:UDP-2,4-diacetamido-2,4,6-trideoxy-beta-L-altropyranose hydrolase